MIKFQQLGQPETPQNEEDNLARLEEIEGVILQNTDILREWFNGVDLTVLQSINLRKNPPNGQLVYPKFDQKNCYYQEFWKTFLFNQVLITQVKQFSILNKAMSQRILQTQLLQYEWSQIQLTRHKKKLRRTADLIEKNYICPFDKCRKNYGTDVALNNHMKIKHNCGTKTDRENLAKEICLSESRGERDTVNINLTFPPGYLDYYRDHVFKRDKLRSV